MKKYLHLLLAVTSAYGMGYYHAANQPEVVWRIIGGLIMLNFLGVGDILRQWSKEEGK